MARPARREKSVDSAAVSLVYWGLPGPAGRFPAVAAGNFYSLALRIDGTLAGWGENSSGQSNVPTGTFPAVAAGGSHGLAIRTDGTLAGWGRNVEGQITVPAGAPPALAARPQQRV